MARPLEAGDWVIARDLAGEVSPGLGKLTGGDYEGERLVRARVELASGVRWFGPGELDRVTPAGEAHLLTAALEQELIPAASVPRLLDLLRRFAEGSLLFARTPGLLDALWGLFVGPAATSGLAAFFEQAHPEVVALVPDLAGLAPGEDRQGPRLVEAGELVEDRRADRPWAFPDDDDGSWSDDEDDDSDEVVGLPPDLEPRPKRRDAALADVAVGAAAALLTSAWTRGEMIERIEQAFSASGSWIEGLVDRTLAAHPQRPPLDEETLALLLLEDEGLIDEFEQTDLRVVVRYLVPAVSSSPPLFPVRALDGIPAVAAWLGLDEADLDWFADRQGWLVREPEGPLQHYRYHLLRKPSGGRRLVEAPKERLKLIQRRILREILDRVPPHDAAHGFRRGRSVATFAEPHCRQQLVLRMDLRHFFPSVGAARVAAIFRALGYSRPVGFVLALLCTTRTPEEVIDRARLDVAAVDRLRRRHLPQGAPTSPALANLASFGLDVRLAAAAAGSAGRYSRYADDLAFSGGGPFRRQASRFRRLVLRIAADEGFAIHWRKNRWMRPCQRQRLAGLVVNERARPARADYDRLKATLFNCARHGPASQNRSGHPDFQAHLRGRVAWFRHTDPRRGDRLQALFDRIEWG